MMRFFRPRDLIAIDLPDEIADQARALAIALANPGTPLDERMALRRAFSKTLSARAWSIRISAWDEFNRQVWVRYEASARAFDRRPASARGGRSAAGHFAVSL